MQAILISYVAIGIVFWLGSYLEWHFESQAAKDASPLEYSGTVTVALICFCFAWWAIVHYELSVKEANHG